MLAIRYQVQWQRASSEFQMLRKPSLFRQTISYKDKWYDKVFLVFSIHPVSAVDRDSHDFRFRGNSWRSTHLDTTPSHETSCTILYAF